MENSTAYDTMLLEDLCDIIQNDLPFEIVVFILAEIEKKCLKRKSEKERK